MLLVNLLELMQSSSFDFFLKNIISTYAEKIAIKTKDTEISYSTLDYKINALSMKIHHAGIKKGDVVALFLDRNEDMIISMFACLRLGCVFFPINLNLPLERLAYLLKDSGAKKVISYEALFPKELDIDLILVTYDALENQPPLYEQADVNNLAYLLYTSGSTGLAKGVLIQYGSMINLFASLKNKMDFSSSDVFLALTDYSFDVSLIELLLPIILGATVVIAESGAIVDGYKIQTYLNQYAITVMQATPTTWELLLKSGWSNQGNFKILVGGEIFYTYLANQLAYHQKNVWNLYGPTETTMWSTLYHLDDCLSTISVPIGKPLDNTLTLILDEDLKPALEGELYIGGAGLAHSYLNRKELTQSKFLTLDQDQALYYKTGDLVKQLADGNLLFLDRMDDQIKIGGLRIEPGEIENHLMSHPMVKKAIVLSQGEGYCKNLIAFIEYNEEKLYKEYKPYYENLTIDNWKAVYDRVHDFSNKNICCHGINSIGWTSGFNKEFISTQEIEENLDLLINKLKKLDLSSVLEVGCGLGNVLQRLKNFFTCYTGIDISPITIAKLQEKLDEKIKLKCNLFVSSIQDIDSSLKYSCIIVNSVIQYFPSSYYLLEVIEKLIDLTEKGGNIVFGDVRSSEMLELFFLLKNKKNEEHGILNDYLKAKELELVLPSDFFSSLTQLFSRVSHVDIDVKRGHFNNELNIFRFDAIIYLDTPIIKQKPKSVAWDEAIKDLPSLLADARDQALCITKVPNIFIEKELESLNFQAQALPFISITEYEKNQINSLVNHFTDEKISLYLHYDAQYPWNYLTVILNSHSEVGLIRAEIMESKEGGYSLREPFSSYLNDYISQEMEKYALKHLPKLLCPSYFYWLDKWPVTNNQKIDRKILASIKQPDLINQESNKKIESLHRLYFKVMNKFIPSDLPILSSGISSLTIHHFLHLLNEEFNAGLKLSDISKDLTIESLVTILE